jgi:hypothetical protein
MQEQQIAEQIRDTIKDWMDGKVDKVEFDRFLSQANRNLAALKAEKVAKERRDWEDLNWRTMY